MLAVCLERVELMTYLALGVTIIDTVDARPLRPWVISSTLWWWLREQFKVCNRFGAMTDGGSNTIVASITSSNDDDVLVLGRDILAIFEFRIKQRLCVCVQKLHGKVNSVQSTGYLGGRGQNSAREVTLLLTPVTF